MTTVTASRREKSFPPQTVVRWRSALLSRERQLFALGTALVLVHLLDASFVDPGRGVSSGDNWLGFVVPAAVMLVAAFAYDALPAAPRVAISFVLGLLAFFAGYLHAAHIAWDAPEGSDYTGILLLAAAGSFLLLATAILLRPKGPRSAFGRWSRRAGALVAALVLAFFVVLPVGVALWQTQKPRQPVDAAVLATPHQQVTLTTSDGLDLAGWYIASHNGGAVLLVHGGGGSRTGVAQHAAMLARNGYGVLLYDARGRGESEGRTDGYGWTWGKDVAAALAYLKSRPDVAPHRIGALGLSTGADVLIEAAASGSDIDALVADGATARSFADARDVVGVDALPYWWGVFGSVRIFSGAKPGPPLDELVPRVSPTPLLLISADWDIERKANLHYAQAARPPVQHWQLPDGVGHTHGLRDLRTTYERHVVAFFDRALLSDKERRKTGTKASS